MPRVVSIAIATIALATTGLTGCAHVGTSNAVASGTPAANLKDPAAGARRYSEAAHKQFVRDMTRQLAGEQYPTAYATEVAECSWRRITTTIPYREFRIHGVEVRRQIVQIGRECGVSPTMY